MSVTVTHVHRWAAKKYGTAATCSRCGKETNMESFRAVDTLFALMRGMLEDEETPRADILAALDEINEGWGR